MDRTARPTRGRPHPHSRPLPAEELRGAGLRVTAARVAILAGAGFSRDEQERMLYRNAERFYRI